MRHSYFYNTEPQTGQLVNGVVASLEEEIGMGNTINEEVPVT
ncbi:PTS system mannose/fructose/sorbose family transporter subunit IID [Tetragenococcus koreensis]